MVLAYFLKDISLSTDIKIGLALKNADLTARTMKTVKKERKPVTAKACPGFGQEEEIPSIPCSDSRFADCLLMTLMELAASLAIRS